MRRLLTLLAVLSLLMVGCSTRQRYPQSVHDAVISLKKVQAATQIGMTYEQFSGLVIEAKAKTNDALPSLSESGLKDAIQDAIDCYADAVTVWQMKVKGQNLYAYSEPGRTLLTKYSIQVSDSADVRATADHDEVVREILRRGGSSVSRASVLLEARE